MLLKWNQIINYIYYYVSLQVICSKIYCHFSIFFFKDVKEYLNLAI